MKLSYKHFEFDTKDLNIEAREILFASISGAHAYGTAKDTSDLDVRVVTRPPLKDLIKLPTPNLQRAKEYRPEKGVDVTVINVWSFLQKLLTRGNGNFLENLFQYMIVPGEKGWSRHAFRWRVEFIEDLQEDVMRFGITSKFANHYKGFYKGQLADYEKRGNNKCLLYAYRVALSGLHLVRNNEVRMSLLHLIHLPWPHYIQIKELKKLYSRYMSGVRMDPFLPTVEGELQGIEIAIETEAKKLPSTVENWQPFNEWLWRLWNIGESI